MICHRMGRPQQHDWNSTQVRIYTQHAGGLLGHSVFIRISTFFPITVHTEQFQCNQVIIWMILTVPYTLKTEKHLECCSYTSPSFKKNKRYYFWPHQLWTMWRLQVATESLTRDSRGSISFKVSYGQLLIMQDIFGLWRILQPGISSDFFSFYTALGCSQSHSAAHCHGACDVLSVSLRKGLISSRPRLHLSRTAKQTCFGTTFPLKKYSINRLATNSSRTVAWFKMAKNKKDLGHG